MYVLPHKVRRAGYRMDLGVKESQAPCIHCAWKRWTYYSLLEPNLDVWRWELLDGNASTGGGPRDCDPKVGDGQKHGRDAKGVKCPSHDLGWGTGSRGERLGIVEVVFWVTNEGFSLCWVVEIRL